MKKILLVLISVLALSIGLNPVSSKAAIADGTHNLPFQVNKPGSSSASMANDYFMKPAKLIVSNGTMKIQITIKNSSWVTEFNPPGGATVVSSNPAADQRVVQFNVSNLNTLKIPMTIDIDDIDYHHSYSVDFVFNSAGLPQAAAEKPNSSTNTGSTTNANNGNNSNNSGNTTTEKPNASQGSQSSQDANSNQNEDATDKENQATEDENVEDENSEEEPNPDTSDSFPYYALVLLFVSAILLGSKKKLI